MGENWLPRVYEYINAHFDAEHLPRMLELVRIPSIAGTGEGIEECAAKVMEMLTWLGCEDVHLERYVKSPIVVGRLKADVEDAPTLCMYGMYDVQPPEPLEEWSVPPYEGAIRDVPGFGPSVVARGIANSKGLLVAYLNAVDSIRRTLGYMPFNILFFVEGEEELGSRSMLPFVKAHLAELQASEGVFLNGARQEENLRPYTILGCKGILYIDMECVGGEWGGPEEVDLHSMNAAWLSSPVWRLINALATMRDENDNILIDGFFDDIVPVGDLDRAYTKRMADNFEEDMYLRKRLHARKFLKNTRGEHLHGAEAVEQLLWQPSLNVDGIWAGYTGPATKTVLPYIASCKIDVRMVPNMTAECTLERIRRHLDAHGYGDIRITLRQGTPWSKSAPDGRMARAAVMAMDNSGYENGFVWPLYPGSGPSYTFTQFGIPYISYGLGQSGRIHAPDEFMTVKGLRENEMSCAANLYYLLKLWREEKD